MLTGSPRCRLVIRHSGFVYSGCRRKVACGFPSQSFRKDNTSYLLPNAPEATAASNFFLGMTPFTELLIPGLEVLQTPSNPGVGDFKLTCVDLDRKEVATVVAGVLGLPSTSGRPFATYVRKVNSVGGFGADLPANVDSAWMAREVAKAAAKYLKTPRIALLNPSAYMSTIYELKKDT